MNPGGPVRAPAADPGRLLVLRGGALGDVILTLPVLRALRTHWPHASLELWAYPHGLVLGRLAGTVTEGLSLDDAGTAALFSPGPLPDRLLKRLRRADRIVSFLHDPDGCVNRHLAALGAQAVIAASPLVSNRHAVDHFLAPLGVWGVQAPAHASPELMVPDSLREQGRCRAGENGRPFIVLHPGSGSLRKNWPAPAFHELARILETRTGCRIVSLLGPAEEEQSGFAEWPGSVLRGLSLGEVAGVLAAAQVYVGNDSGITHFAAAVGVPTVALFGPTDPALWAPRGRHVRLLRCEPLCDLEAGPVAEAVCSLLCESR